MWQTSNVGLSQLVSFPKVWNWKERGSSQCAVDSEAGGSRGPGAGGVGRRGGVPLLHARPWFDCPFPMKILFHL